MDQKQPKNAGGGGSKRKLVFISSLISTSLILFIIVGIATTSASAGPDSNLYPVKRILENVHTALTFGDLDKAKLETSHAEARLYEIMAMAREGESRRITEPYEDFSQCIDAARNYADQAAANDKQLGEIDAKINSLLALKDVTLIQFADSMPPELEHAVQEAFENSGYFVTGNGRDPGAQHRSFTGAAEQIFSLF